MAPTVFRAICANETYTAKFSMGAVRTPVISALSLGATNWTTIATFNADAASNDNLSDAIGMILKVLHAYGMMQGAVTA